MMLKSCLVVIFVYLIFSELLPVVAGAFEPCPVPLLKNGRAKILMRGRSVKFKCFRPYIMIGKLLRTFIKTKNITMF